MKISLGTRWTWVAVLFSVLLIAAPGAAQDDPPGRVARLSYTQGTVSLQLSGAQQWNQASPNYPLTTGDRVYTDHDGRAELDLGDIAIQLSSDTDLTVANLNDQFLQLGIGQGTLRVRVFDILEGNSIEVDTPNGALTLLAPGDYRVETYPDDNTTLVSAYSGSLEISGGDFSQFLDGGRAVKLSGTDPIVAMRVSLPDADEFDQWCESRNQRGLSSDSARYVSRDIPGYHELDNHGNWMVTAQYGPVWYPGDVPLNWAPYRYGRWIWIEPWGWTWVDDAPWGFTPFHYGRWAHLGSRWCWVPGRMMARPVYAPALVAFVGGRNFAVALSFGEGSVQAWFPLGPHEPYYPWYHHDDDYLRRVNVNNVANVSNIANVQNVDNIRYVNRNFGTTAVPAATMRQGQPVPRQIIRVSPQQSAQARIIPHPTVSPSIEAAVGGRPTNAPPIRPPRVVFKPSVARTPPDSNSPVTRPGQPPAVTRPAPGTPDEPAPRVRQGPPPTRVTPPTNRGNEPNVAPAIQSEPPQAVRPDQVTAPKAGPAGVRNVPDNSQPARPRWIIRTPPPPSNPPFAKEQPALQQHPGRPLEPQQVDNIRTGRPAGPMRDREIPPHTAAQQGHGDKPAPASGKEAKPPKQNKPPDRRQN